MNWRDYHNPSSMPGFSDPADLVAAGWRKRKRDHEDSATLVRPPMFAPFRVDRSDRDTCLLPPSRHPTETGDHSFRPRCLPRKRRHVQAPYLTLPTHQQSPLLPQVSTPQLRAPIPHPCLPGPFLSPTSLLRPPHFVPATSATAVPQRDKSWMHMQTAISVVNGHASSVSANVTLSPVVAPMGTQESLAIQIFTAPRDRLISKAQILEEKSARAGITETGTEIVQCLDCVRGHSATWPAGSVAPGWTLDAMNHDRMIG
ncbi:hypothetical protein N7504_007367 [Penicillium tannophilum]|nr:hypothetical protein N7504_007367 [Penicillium tannophilum]